MAGDAHPRATPRRFFEVFRYPPRAFSLVWRTRRGLSALLLALSFAAGLLPAAVAFVGKLIVDGVVRAAETGEAADRHAVRLSVLGELALVLGVAGAQCSTSPPRRWTRRPRRRSSSASATSPRTASPS